MLNARHPDLTIIDKSKNMVTLVDVSIPVDKRILEKEQEKITKYQDLWIQFPVVIGALGAVSSRFHDFIRHLELHKFESVYFTEVSDSWNCLNFEKGSSALRCWLH